MPTYQYACKACDHRFEQVQSFSEDSLTVCPECSGALRKVYGSVGIVFKGTGFYRTDSRAGNESAIAAKDDSGAKNGGAKDSGAKDSGSKDGGDKKSEVPAAKGAEKSGSPGSSSSSTAHSNAASSSSASSSPAAAAAS